MAIRPIVNDLLCVLLPALLLAGGLLALGLGDTGADILPTAQSVFVIVMVAAIAGQFGPWPGVRIFSSVFLIACFAYIMLAIWIGDAAIHPGDGGRHSLPTSQLLSWLWLRAAEGSSIPSISRPGYVAY